MKRLTLLFAALVGAGGAVAQNDTALVPFVVNVDAVITAQLNDGAALVSLVQISATGDEETILKLPLLKSNVGVALVTRRQPNAMPVVSNRGGTVTLNLPAQSYKNAEIALYAVNGKRILRKKLSASGGVNNISRQTVAPGAYLLSVKGTDDNRITSRLTHGGGNLAFNVFFGLSEAESAASAPSMMAKRAAVENWTVTVSAAGYHDSSYALKIVAGANPAQNITLREAAPASSGEYAVKVSSVGTDASGSGNYAPGATVGINAGTTPSGYRFVKWTALNAGVFFANANNAATTFMMPSAAVTVTANFEPNTYPVTVSSVGAGATGGGDYLPGATVNIAAGTPPEGLWFKKWTTSANTVTLADADSATTSFTMPSGAVTVTANIEAKYAVTVSSAGTGATGSGEYFAGDTVKIKAGTAPTEQRFKIWTAEGGVTLAKADSTETKFIMPANAVTVTANFEANTFRVTVVSAGAGATGSGDYLPGKTVNITAGTVPDGVTFKGWTSSNSGLIFADAGSAATAFIMPSVSVTVTANFVDYFTDNRDGKKYKYVTIGGVMWMSENLNFETSSGSWCYDGSADNCAKYGRLYDWNTAKTACPNGWHLPSREEWGTLAKTAGGTGMYGDGGTAGEKLKSKSGWHNSGIGGYGTDDYGFSALPGGLRLSGGYFDRAGLDGSWWTATESGSSYAYYRGMHFYPGTVSEHYDDKSGGFSVRCVWD
jgi:uncharacterized protein (TIGR02145 family)/uncharacterized repeat protein (TIGR02543 family)